MPRPNRRRRAWLGLRGEMVRRRASRLPTVADAPVWHACQAETPGVNLSLNEPETEKFTSRVSVLLAISRHFDFGAIVAFRNDASGTACPLWSWWPPPHPLFATSRVEHLRIGLLKNFAPGLLA